MFYPQILWVHTYYQIILKTAKCNAKCEQSLSSTVQKQKTNKQKIQTHHNLIFAKRFVYLLGKYYNFIVPKLT